MLEKPLKTLNHMTKTTTPSFEKGLKQLLFLLGLLIFSPIILSFGFKALRIYTETPKAYVAYLLLALGASLILFTIYFGFKTFKTFLDTLFEK
ncbi:probable transmembrane protein [Tenacibaculum maritimum]|nr:probable transmembrane protein [Tenacibaculum maritimum]